MPSPFRLNEVFWTGVGTAAGGGIGAVIALFYGNVPLAYLLGGGSAFLAGYTLYKSIDTPARRDAEVRRAFKAAARLPKCPRCGRPAAWRRMPGAEISARTWICEICGAKLGARVGAGMVTAARVVFVLTWLGMLFFFRQAVPGLRSAFVVASAIALWVLIALARRVRLVDDGDYCPACGYDRAGNVTGICSECGESLPDLDALTARSEPPSAD